MKLFNPLLSEYSLTGTCNSVKNCIWGIGKYNKEELSKDMEKDSEFSAHIFPLD